MNIIEINWINFTPAKFSPINNGKTKLEDLYKNPSFIKRNVFEFWKNELDEIYWLTGNQMMFTIYGKIKDNLDWTIYNVKITKSYNYILN
jgi:hypothetical protein